MEKITLTIDANLEQEKFTSGDQCVCGCRKISEKTAAIEKIVYGAALIFLNKDTSNRPSQSFIGLPELPINKLSKGRPDEAVLRSIVFSSLFRA